MRSPFRRRENEGNMHHCKGKLHWILVLWLTSASSALCCATQCPLPSASATKDVQNKNCDSCASQQSDQQVPTDSQKPCCQDSSLMASPADIQSYASQDISVTAIAWVRGMTDTQMVDQSALQIHRLNLPPPRLQDSLVALGCMLTI
jgi:hypothetical protein